jgi:hypothetical protein
VQLKKRVSVVVWQGPRTRPDPLLWTPAWRREIRGYWKRRRLPCQCGCVPPMEIAYDSPTFLLVNGKRRLNPASLAVGHILSRYEARQLGWSEQQINSLSNTRPERADHSLRSGAELGERVRQGWQPKPAPVTPPDTVRHIDTASRW